MLAFGDPTPTALARIARVSGTHGTRNLVAQHVSARSETNITLACRQADHRCLRPPAEIAALHTRPGHLSMTHDIYDRIRAPRVSRTRSIRHLGACRRGRHAVQ